MTEPNRSTEAINTERYVLIAGGDGYTSMIVEGRAAMERAFLNLHWDPIDFISLTDEQREMLGCIRDEDQWMMDALHGRIAFDVQHEDGWVKVFRLVNPLKSSGEPGALHLVDDQPVTPMPERCVNCRTGFDSAGKPIYARLIEKDGYFCCERCGGSYGAICSDCPPHEYPTAKTRCLPCPRRALTKAEKP
jgi:hypothetical protein